MKPSLSVTQTVPSRAQERRAGALLAGERQAPESSASTNHLNPTGTSSTPRPRSAATRSIIELETSVLPTPAAAGQCGRWRKR